MRLYRDQHKCREMILQVQIAGYVSISWLALRYTLRLRPVLLLSGCSIWLVIDADLVCFFCCHVFLNEFCENHSRFPTKLIYIYIYIIYDM